MTTHRPFRDEASSRGRWADERLREGVATVDELEDLLVKGGAAVIATDLDGLVTHWSAAAERLYGWSGDEAVGLPIVDLLVTMRDQGLAEEIMESIRSTGNWEGEFDVQRKDGSEMLIFVRDTLIKDDVGRPVGILGVSMDVNAPSRTARQPPAA